MDNPRPDKVAVVDEVRSHLDEADAVIVTEYRGLKVKDLAALRRSIAPLGADYKIYKNTLVRLAAEQRPNGFVDLVSAPTALTFVQGDAAAVTKALRDFARANPLLVIKGGLLGNSVLGAQATAALADLPSREVLLARIAGALAAPMQSLAGLLAAVPRNFAYGLAALRDERAAGAPIPEVTSTAGSASAAASEEPASAEAPATDEAPAAEAPAAEGAWPQKHRQSRAKPRPQKHQTQKPRPPKPRPQKHRPQKHRAEAPAAKHRPQKHRPPKHRPKRPMAQSPLPQSPKPPSPKPPSPKPPSPKPPSQNPGH